MPLMIGLPILHDKHSLFLYQNGNSTKFMNLNNPLLRHLSRSASLVFIKPVSIYLFIYIWIHSLVMVLLHGICLFLWQILIILWGQVNTYICEYNIEKQLHKPCQAKALARRTTGSIRGQALLP